MRLHSSCPDVQHHNGQLMSDELPMHGKHVHVCDWGGTLAIIAVFEVEVLMLADSSGKKQTKKY